MNHAASYRAEGARLLRLARSLAAPRRVGRPRKGDTAPRIHDREAERRKALRRARYWYTTAARFVKVSRRGIESARPQAHDESGEFRARREMAVAS